MKNIKNYQIKTIIGKIIIKKTSKIPSGKIIQICINYRDILVGNIDREFCIIDNLCSHHSMPKGK